MSCKKVVVNGAESQHTTVLSGVPQTYQDFKDFPIRLKGNLREEDNLSTRDKWPVPNVSFVRRFYCITPQDANLIVGIRKNII